MLICWDSCRVLFTLTAPADGFKWVYKLEWESGHLKDHISRPQCEYFFVTLSARKRRVWQMTSVVSGLFFRNMLQHPAPITGHGVNQLNLYNKRLPSETKMIFLRALWAHTNNSKKNGQKRQKSWPKNHKSNISNLHGGTKRTFVENSHIAISFDIY